MARRQILLCWTLLIGQTQIQHLIQTCVQINLHNGEAPGATRITIRTGMDVSCNVIQNTDLLWRQVIWRFHVFFVYFHYIHSKIGLVPQLIQRPAQLAFVVIRSSVKIAFKALHVFFNLLLDTFPNPPGSSDAVKSQTGIRKRKCDSAVRNRGTQFSKLICGWTHLRIPYLHRCSLHWRYNLIELKKTSFITLLHKGKVKCPWCITMKQMSGCGRNNVNIQRRCPLFKVKRFERWCFRGPPLRSLALIFSYSHI